jgi:hypothetical protein
MLGRVCRDREKGGGEASGSCDGASCLCGAARRRGWVEIECPAGTAETAAEQSEDGPAVHGPEAAEETAVGDDTAEGSAGSGGADDVGRIVEAEEDVLHDAVELPRWYVNHY